MFEIPRIVNEYETLLRRLFETRLNAVSPTNILTEKHPHHHKWLATRVSMNILYSGRVYIDIN